MDTELRQLLDRAMADMPTPVDLADRAAVGYQQHRQRRRIAGALATVAAAVTAGVVWSAASGTDNAGISTVVPAASPTTAPASPDLAAFERSGSTGPLLPGERRWAPNMRVIPATGVTPAISAEQAKAAAYPHPDVYRPSKLNAQLSYMTDDGLIDGTPVGKLTSDPKYRIVVNRLVWIIVEPDGFDRTNIGRPSDKKAPFFTAIDATTGKSIISWQGGDEERGIGAPPDR